MKPAHQRMKPARQRMKQSRKEVKLSLYELEQEYLKSETNLRALVHLSQVEKNQFSKPEDFFDNFNVLSPAGLVTTMPW